MARREPLIYGVAAWLRLTEPRISRLRTSPRFRSARAACVVVGVASCLAGLEPAPPEPRPPSGLLVTPVWTAAEPGTPLQLTAALSEPPGDTLAAGIPAWSSTRSAVASVDSTGLVTAIAPGVAKIQAFLGHLGGEAVIVVGPPQLVGAGDIADCARLSAQETAAALDTIPGVVFAAGDNAYQDGTAQEYASCYAPTWGRHRARTRPTPGNHEYHTPGALPYFAYFGANAGESSEGYYSYEIGAWHVVAINSNIARGPGSPQEQWLRADLAAHTTPCTVAYWHFPRFSSGVLGNDTTMIAIWQALYDAGADVVISGHDHHYERFAPQAPDGTRDATRGIREFVVGTGGGPMTDLVKVQANSQGRVT